MQTESERAVRTYQAQVSLQSPMVLINSAPLFTANSGDNNSSLPARKETTLPKGIVPETVIRFEAL